VPAVGAQGVRHQRLVQARAWPPFQGRGGRQARPGLAQGVGHPPAQQGVHDLEERDHGERERVAGAADDRHGVLDRGGGLLASAVPHLPHLVAGQRRGEGRGIRRRVGAQPLGERRGVLLHALEHPGGPELELERGLDGRRRRMPGEVVLGELDRGRPLAGQHERVHGGEGQLVPRVIRVVRVVGRG
jgi:hypothetical protein